MNPMYDCSGRLDRFGGITEPPDDFPYEEEPERQWPDETDTACRDD